jgi:hypothetical protein
LNGALHEFVAKVHERQNAADEGSDLEISYACGVDAVARLEFSILSEQAGLMRIKKKPWEMIRWR